MYKNSFTRKRYKNKNKSKKEKMRGGGKDGNISKCVEYFRNMMTRSIEHSMHYIYSISDRHRNFLETLFNTYQEYQSEQEKELEKDHDIVEYHLEPLKNLIDNLTLNPINSIDPISIDSFDQQQRYCSSIYFTASQFYKDVASIISTLRHKDYRFSVDDETIIQEFTENITQIIFCANTIRLINVSLLDEIETDKTELNTSKPDKTEIITPKPKKTARNFYGFLKRDKPKVTS
jgi:hypothetical protein